MSFENILLVSGLAWSAISIGTLAISFYWFRQDCSNENDYFVN